MKKAPDIEPYTPSLAADLDVFRKELMRRLVDRNEGWRRCRKPACRRQHTCLGDSTVCVREGRPPPVFSAEEEAEARRDFQMAMKKRRAELEAQAGQQNQEERSARRSAHNRNKSGQSAHRQMAAKPWRSGAP